MFVLLSCPAFFPFLHRNHLHIASCTSTVAHLKQRNTCLSRYGVHWPIRADWALKRWRRAWGPFAALNIEKQWNLISTFKCLIVIVPRCLSVTKKYGSKSLAKHILFMSSLTKLGWYKQKQTFCFIKMENRSANYFFYLIKIKILMKSALCCNKIWLKMAEKSSYLPQFCHKKTESIL